MSPNNGTNKLKAALLFSIVVHVFYGKGNFKMRQRR